MNPKRTHFKVMSVLLSILLLSSTAVLPANASAGTIYESESNNTYSTADVTYDDYDNYGSLPANDVEDWWKISITAEGIANFYLGNIPSGCNYELQLYDYKGTNKLAESLKTSNSSELVKCHVRAGETYYIRVFRASYPGTLSSANYQLRVKRYDLQSANIFSSLECYGTSLLSQRKISTALNYFCTKADEMDFNSAQYVEQPANTTLEKYTTSSIFVIFGAGDAGYMRLSITSEIHGIGTYNDAFIAAVSTLSTNALSNLPLVIYAGDRSGITDTDDAGNLVTQTLNKGAFNVIGWEERVELADLNRWLCKLMDYCVAGNNLGNAITLTNAWAAGSDAQISNVDTITAITYGSSRLWATLLG